MKWVRPFHRWTSIVFTLTVIANFVAMSFGTPPAWVTYSPLLPLALLMFTGLYMFFARSVEGSKAPASPRH